MISSTQKRASNAHLLFEQRLRYCIFTIIKPHYVNSKATLTSMQKTGWSYQATAGGNCLRQVFGDLPEHELIHLCSTIKQKAQKLMN